MAAELFTKAMVTGQFSFLEPGSFGAREQDSFVRLSRMKLSILVHNLYRLRCVAVAFVFVSEKEKVCPFATDNDRRANFAAGQVRERNRKKNDVISRAVH